MSDLTKSSFEASLSSDLAQRIVFAKYIPSICKQAKPKWIIKQLIPFLTNWIRADEQETLNYITNSLKILAASSHGLIHIAPLIVRITSFEIPYINSQIIKTILKFPNEPTAKVFIDRLFDSEFDVTRSIIPKICQILDNDSEIISTLTRVAEDASYTVKLSLIKILPTLEPSIAYQISNILISDSQGKIRQYLPAAIIGFDFFEELIPNFSADYEWVVRAALASQLYKISFNDDIMKAVLNLIEDYVWEVKLNAAQSLLKILKNRTDIGKTDTDKLIECLVNHFYDLESVTLKNTFGDLIAYASKFGFPQKVLSVFVRNMISVQPPEVIVHFVETVLTNKLEKFIALIETLIETATDKIMNSGTWRVQSQYLSSLPILLNYTKDKDVQLEIVRIILRDACSSGDGSRKAVAVFCSKVIKLIPETRQMIEKLKNGTYKERQLLIMIASETNDSGILEIASDLFNDPVENVAEMAIELLQRKLGNAMT